MVVRGWPKSTMRLHEDFEWSDSVWQFAQLSPEKPLFGLLKENESPNNGEVAGRLPYLPITSRAINGRDFLFYAREHPESNANAVSSVARDGLRGKPREMRHRRLVEKSGRIREITAFHRIFVQLPDRRRGPPC